MIFEILSLILDSYCIFFAMNLQFYNFLVLKTRVEGE